MPRSLSFAMPLMRGSVIVEVATGGMASAADWSHDLQEKIREQAVMEMSKLRTGFGGVKEKSTSSKALADVFLRF